MGNCVEKVESKDYELDKIGDIFDDIDDFKPLPEIKIINKKYIYKNKKRKEYNFKNNLYWIYLNELYFKNNI